MGAIHKGATAGGVRGTSIPGTRVFYRPSLGKIVFRPTNVIRSSEKVMARNKKVQDHPPAAACKGKSWKDFIHCLSVQMKKL